MVRATASDADGRSVTKTIRFRTLKPARIEDTTIFEGYGQTYGVGMPITLTFSTPVVNKAAVEGALEAANVQAGGRRLVLGRRQHALFRPRTYWPAGPPSSSSATWTASRPPPASTACTR